MSGSLLSASAWPSPVDGRSRRTSDELLALDEVREPRAEVRAQVVALDGQLHRRLEEVEGVADVESASLEAVRVDGLLLRQQVDRVGQLDLTAAPGRGPAERREDLRGEDVAADRRQVGWRLAGRRLLDDRK